MQRTPKGLRLHIAILGRCNVGKSSVLNALTGQNVAIVSDVMGTTTDPVEKPMELLPIGPVLFVDTAGLDDIGALAALRADKTVRVLGRTDIALLVTEADTWSYYEETWSEELRRRQIPTLIILNKIDRASSEDVARQVERSGLPWVAVSATTGQGVLDAKQAIVQTVPDHWHRQAGILDGMVDAGDTVVLVIPIDKEAPKGRLILPQVQTLRDILDKKADALVTDETRVSNAIATLTKSPALVITDSQVFKKVADATPPDLALTSFSVLFARHKGDLDSLVAGAKAIDTLRGDDKVLICEACTHHPVEDDIGRDKIPRWLRGRAGHNLECDVVSGRDFPDRLEGYSLVIHCGACMFNRRQMISRIIACQKQNVPITNYGLAIAHLHGILDMALAPLGRGRSHGPFRADCLSVEPFANGRVCSLTSGLT